MRRRRDELWDDSYGDGKGYGVPEGLYLDQEADDATNQE